MQFIDLKSQYNFMQKEIEHEVLDTLRSGQFIMGPKVDLLEETLIEYTGRKHAISCSSGTDALLMSLMSLNIGKDDYVITTPFTFIATAEVIALLGAKPIFVDVDNSYNISSRAIEECLEHIHKINKLSKVKAIISVDLFGLPADYCKIEVIAQNYSIPLIADSAQSFGSTYKTYRTCSYGDICTTSFFPAKPLGCYGDGGAIFTDSDELASKMKSIRVHGMDKDDKYNNIRLGLTARLDAVQAAVLNVKIKYLKDEIIERNKLAKKYNEAFSGTDLITPIAQNCKKSAWAQYTLRHENRDYIVESLTKKNIPTAIYYPIPLHKQKVFQDFDSYNFNLDNSEKFSREVFSLPMHPYMKDSDFEKIIEECLCLV